MEENDRIDDQDEIIDLGDPDDLDDAADLVAQISSGDERASALAAVLKDRAAKTTVVPRRRPPSGGRVAFGYLALAVSTVLAFWIWFFPPGWAQRTPIPVPSLAEEETSLRLVMFLQAQRIEAYRAENGRLPERLEEAGPPLPGVRYTPLAGETYYLRGEGDQAVLGYFSSQPMDAFLGDSEDLLAVELEG